MAMGRVSSGFDLGPLPGQKKGSPLRLVKFYSMLNVQSLTAPSTVGREVKAFLEKVAIMAPKL